MRRVQQRVFGRGMCEDRATPKCSRRKRVDMKFKLVDTNTLSFTELGVISAIAATHSSMFPRTNSFPALSGAESWRHNSRDADNTEGDADIDDIDDDDDDDDEADNGWIGFKPAHKGENGILRSCPASRVQLAPPCAPRALTIFAVVPFFTVVLARGGSRGLPKPRSRTDLPGSGISQLLGQGKTSLLHRVESSSSDALTNDDGDYDYGCFAFTEDGRHASDMACCPRQVTCEKTDIEDFEPDSEVRMKEERCSNMSIGNCCVMELLDVLRESLRLLADRYTVTQKLLTTNLPTVVAIPHIIPILTPPPNICLYYLASIRSFAGTLSCR